MKDRTVLALSRLTRPHMRRKGLLGYRLCRLLLSLAFPRQRGGEPVRLIVPFEGGRVHVDTSSSLEYSLLFRGSHEPEVADLIRHCVEPGHVCLDVGANVGAHTLVMARQAGPSGRVLAFEPHPRIAERLRANVVLNALANVTVVEAALSDEDGQAPFFGFREGSTRQGLSSLLPDENAAEEMSVATLDAGRLLERYELPSLDFVKVDVEGNDAVVVAALLPLIERFRPFIVFEYRQKHWKKFGRDLDATLDGLRPLGYRFYVVQDETTRPYGEGASNEGDLFCLPDRAGVDASAAP